MLKHLLMIHQMNKKWMVVSLYIFNDKIWVGLCINKRKEQKPTERTYAIFKIASLHLSDQHNFMWKSLEILNVFNILYLKQVFWKNYNLKTGVLFFTWKYYNWKHNCLLQEIIEYVYGDEFQNISKVKQVESIISAELCQTDQWNRIRSNMKMDLLNSLLMLSMSDQSFGKKANDKIVVEALRKYEFMNHHKNKCKNKYINSMKRDVMNILH